MRSSMHRSWVVAAFWVSVSAAPIAGVAADESVAITGRAVDAASGKGVGGAELTIGSQSAVTDADGRFQIELSPGHWQVEISAGDYLSRSLSVEVTHEARTPLEVALVPKARFQERLEVTAPEPTPDGPAALPMRPSQVLSTAGSLDNPFRTLQTLPGVAGTNEFGSQLSVRGGGPDQNLTVMDGVEIHNPYRLFGLTSAFNPETIERFDLVAGGFGARYGDRLSSLLLVENRDGDTSRGFNASSSISITDGNAILEGRLPGPGAGSWLATARRTYYDLVAERFVKEDLPSFNDYQLKTAWNVGPGRRLSLLGLRSRETTDVTPDDEPDASLLIRSRNDLLAASFVTPVAGGVSRSLVSWSRNTDLIDVKDPEEAERPALDDEVDFNRQLAVRDLSLREELSLPAFGRHQLQTGFEWHRLRTRAAFVTAEGLDPFALFSGELLGLEGDFPEQLDSSRTTARGGAWVEDHIQLTSSAVLVPGLRWDASGLNGRHTLSPRLSAVVKLGSATRLTTAAGLYTQSPGYEKLLQADHFTNLADAARLDLRPERARHAVLGLERDLAPGLLGRAELYYKSFDDLILGRLETEEERLARVARYDFPAELQWSVPSAPLVTSVPTNGGRGSAYGFELYLSRVPRTTGAPLTGWISYSFGKTQEEAYGRSFPFKYDRRHGLNVVWNWRPGSRFELAGTARFASGFPWTPASGFRVSSVEQHSRLVPVLDRNGRAFLEVAPGGVANLNSGRLPGFARLDLRLSYRPRGENGRWQLYLEGLNVLNHKNPWFIDSTLERDPASNQFRIVEEGVGGLPRVVTFGVRFRLR